MLISLGWGGPRSIACGGPPLGVGHPYPPFCSRIMRCLVSCNSRNLSSIIIGPLVIAVVEIAILPPLPRWLTCRAPLAASPTVCPGLVTAGRLGFDFQRMRQDVLTLYRLLHGRLTDAHLVGWDEPDGGRYFLSRLVGLPIRASSESGASFRMGEDDPSKMFMLRAISRNWFRFPFHEYRWGNRKRKETDWKRTVPLPP